MTDLEVCRRNRGRPGKRERLVQAATRADPRTGSRTHDARRVARRRRPLGNVYYYFKSKDDLVAAVIDGHVQGVDDQQGAPKSTTRTPKARLYMFIRQLTDRRDLIAQFGCPQGTKCSEFEKSGEHEDISRLMTRPMAWLEEQFGALGRKDSPCIAISLLVSPPGHGCTHAHVARPVPARRCSQTTRTLGRLAVAGNCLLPDARPGLLVPDLDDADDAERRASSASSRSGTSRPGRASGSQRFPATASRPSVRVLAALASSDGSRKVGEQSRALVCTKSAIASSWASFRPSAQTVLPATPSVASLGARRLHVAALLELRAESPVRAAVLRDQVAAIGELLG